MIISLRTRGVLLTEIIMEGGSYVRVRAEFLTNDEHTVGHSDGKEHGVRYFTCAMHYGTFVRVANLHLAPDERQSASASG